MRYFSTVHRNNRCLCFSYAQHGCIIENTTAGSETDITDFFLEIEDISGDLADLDARHMAGLIEPKSYHANLSELADRSVDCMLRGMDKYPDSYPLDIDMELIARSLGYRAQDTAIAINQCVYERLTGFPSIDATTDLDLLRNLVDIGNAAANLDHGSLQEPGICPQVELRDAIVGRAVLTAVSFNVDPRRLTASLSAWT